MSRAIAEQVWKTRYRNGRDSSAEADVGATMSRVARAVACIEADDRTWYENFRSILTGCRFLPGGRVLAGAGTKKRVTLFNCFVSGPIYDSTKGLLDSLRETAVTMQQGGGIGIDFSPLRPAGDLAATAGSIASGPVSCMHIWDALCETLLASSHRRGAMIGTLRCDHPDIVSFIDAKREPGVLKNFNLSVLISDDLMTAVRRHEVWNLVHPESDRTVRDSIDARALWLRIVDSAYETGEPGLLFIDKINLENNLRYCERISATNPCGEVPLPPYGACNLGSVNLATLIDEPFSPNAELNRSALRQIVGVAVRFLDDVISISKFPLEQQAVQARRTRRIGLGVTGLADALAMLGHHYDSEAARDFAAGVIRLIRDAAYAASVELAREKGAFEAFDKDRFLAAPFITRLPDTIRDSIAEHGLRNSHLLAIAPAGSISLLAGNVSSGIEPIFALESNRAVSGPDGHVDTFNVRDFAYDRWLAGPEGRTDLPDAFVTAEMLPARAHLDMQARMQPFVDSAISKTVNLSQQASRRDVANAFMFAYRSPIKGCTVFRAGSRGEQVLRACSESRGCDDDASGESETARVVGTEEEIDIAPRGLADVDRLRQGVCVF